MKLSDWLDTPNSDGTRKLRSAFADAINVTPQMISAYCSGKSWPTRETMERIVRETGGAVTANDFLQGDVASCA